MDSIKITLAATLGGLIVLFALQNMAEVELSFLIWTFQSRRFVVIGISLLAGLVVGWLIGVTYERRRASNEN